MDNLVLAHSGVDLLSWCVYMGGHPFEDGWLLLFQFPNGLQASVCYGPLTRGIEVGVMDGFWLVDVFDNLNSDEVMGALFEVMKRSMA